METIVIDNKEYILNDELELYNGDKKLGQFNSEYKAKEWLKNNLILNN